MCTRQAKYTCTCQWKESPCVWLDEIQYFSWIWSDFLFTANIFVLNYKRSSFYATKIFLWWNIFEFITSSLHIAAISMQIWWEWRENPGIGHSYSSFRSTTYLIHQRGMDLMLQSRQWKNVMKNLTSIQTWLTLLDMPLLFILMMSQFWCCYVFYKPPASITFWIIYESFIIFILLSCS